MSKEPSTNQFSLFKQAPLPEPYKKAVQVVHSKSRGPMTFVQRKTQNALLWNAHVTNEDADGWWSMRTAELARVIGFDSKNREYLRESTYDLMGIVYEWDVLSTAARGPWLKASVLFTDFEISNDQVRYRVNKDLKQQVLNPEMYALIDMQIMRKFKRAATLALYEHCVRFERIGRTSMIPWEKMRDLLLGEGKQVTTYVEYKYFKAKVLKPAIAEINANSDLNVTLKETIAGRRVENIAFEVVRLAPEVIDAPIDSEKAMLLVAELVKLGLQQSEAKKLLRDQSIESVENALSLTKRRMEDKKASKLDKPAAYFRAALKGRWEAEDAKVVTAPKQEPKPRRSKPDELRDRYMAKQMKDAEGYFKELDESDQAGLIERYNQQQQTAGLKIKAKSGKGALVAFYTWLGLETWGTPTTDDLLQFATETLL
jgi:plasmid replication initiation protein